MEKIFNLRVRNELKARGKYMYELAEMLGVSTDTLARKMRKELPAEEQDRIIALIEEETRKGEKDA